MSGKGVVRSIKNIAKGFSDVQIKVREATSNDPWGPSGTLMNEIAQLTFNEPDFIEIMDMIDKRLNDKGKNWRHVFKALLLLDYCLHVGSENVVLYAKENVYVVKTLKEFQHLEENGKDVGANVRQKAKDITNLLVDDNRLKEERRQRQGMRDRMANVGDYLNESVRQLGGTNGQDRWDDENELKKALAESKRIAAEEEKNRRQGDDDLEKALQMSQLEALEKEKKGKEKLEKENTNNLFGGFPQQQNFNHSIVSNPYQQQQQQQQPEQPLQLEWTQPNPIFNPYQQQQQQQPVQNPYLQQHQPLQAQMTGFVHQQPTMDFFSQQQQQQQPLQAQMTGFPMANNTNNTNNQFPSFQSSMVTGTNPFSQLNQPQQLQPQQSQQAQQQKSYDYSELVFGNTNVQQAQQATPPSPAFGSNTPNFGFTPSTSTTNTISSPSFATASANAFSSSNTNTFASSPAFGNTNVFQSSPQLAQAKAASGTDDGKYAKLNSLLANNGDGVDSFGNRNELRIPYGTGFANSLLPQGNNNTLSITDGSSSFPSQTNRNPFGQPNTATDQGTPRQGQKSLLEMMQEQKLQQQQQQQQQFAQSSFF